MVLAAHVVMSAYGFWLPNDPRGSGSSFVGGENLRPFGPATLLTDRSRSVAGRPHDLNLRLAAKRALLRPAVQFDDAQINLIGVGFGNYVLKRRVTVWACAILPDHAHLVIARHLMKAETIAGQMKNEATRKLKKARRHPFAHLEKEGETPSCWGERPWKVFLYSEEEILARVRYVEENPIKAGRPRQTWPSVVPYPTMV